MAKPVLGDIFIGDFPQTQGFGENPDWYARFGIKGHNGLDFGTPSGTQIVSATDGKVIEVGYDQYGYGNYVKVWDPIQLCSCIYGHFSRAVVSPEQMVVRGQLLGLSDNTGNSTGPHLHFGYCRTDENGVRTNTDNGYSGYINPNAYATWDIKNLTEPVKPQTQAESLQAELDKTRIARDQWWNDIMAIKDKLKIGGEYSKTVVLAEIDKLITYEDAVVAKDRQISGLEQQLQELETKIIAQTVELEKTKQSIEDIQFQYQAELELKTEEVSNLHSTVQSLTNENEGYLKSIQDLKTQCKTPIFKGWKLKIYNLLLKA